MNFGQVWELLKQGHSVKRTSWRGYWKLENGMINMYCKDGSVIALTKTQDLVYTIENMVAEDWEVLEEDENTVLDILVFDFSQALRYLKEGKKLARKGWNGKGMFIYYVPENSYPSNTGIAKEQFGEMVDYNPYLAIKNVNNTVSTWVPSINDCLAEDWEVVE